MITITKDDDDRISIIPEYTLDLFLAERAARDIADAIENQAREEAPLGETGALKAHPVDIDIKHRGFAGRPGIPGLSAGEIVTPFPSFGGGFTVRGAGGRFVKGGSVLEPGTRGRNRIPSTPGGDVQEIEITVAREPRHAIWVHNGTGIYGEHKHPIIPTHKKLLKFTYHGIRYLRKSVAGQEANPYLERAYVIINRTYVPVRIEQLRAEIHGT